LVAADYEWWRARGYVREFKGKRYNGHKIGALRDERTDILSWGDWSGLVNTGTQHVMPVGVVGGPGISVEYQQKFVDLGLGTHFVGNSGLYAMRAAAINGASRVLLLGYDCHGTHFFGAHEHPLRQAPEETMEKWTRAHAEMAPTFQAAGIEVINCTEGSAITCYPRGHIEDYLKECA
jgi:hypothetical protein